MSHSDFEGAYDLGTWRGIVRYPLWWACVPFPIIVFALLALGGCQTLGDIGKVFIPVAHSCAVKIDPRPSFPDTPAAIKGATNIEARVNLILAGRLLRDKRIDELEGALAGCQ